MNIKLTVSRRNQTQNIEMEDNSTIEDLLNKIGLKPDTILVISNNKPIPIDDKLVNNQEVTILNVSSGG